MKTIINSLTVVLLLLLAVVSSAKDANSVPSEITWESLTGRHLYLTEFGAWKGGTKASSYYPSAANGNKDERIVYNNNILMWLDAQDGDHYYIFHIDGRYINILNTDGSVKNWLYLNDVYFDNGSLFLLTTDKYSIYRVFYVGK